MERPEIINSVMNYIQNENARYALMINGTWGIGKTYLYDTYLVDEIIEREFCKNDGRKLAYISLYGISSIDELSKQIFTGMVLNYNIKNEKYDKKLKKNMTGWISVLSHAVSFSYGPVTTDLGKLLDGVIEQLNPTNMILFLDDLERCLIPISELFGYVNNLTEHCNCKVIFLADENNIGKTFANTNVEKKYQTILTGDRKIVHDRISEKNDTDGNCITISQLKAFNEELYSENYIYSDIKEKVIGKTLNYTPSVKGALTDLIKGYRENRGYVPDGKYKDFLIGNLDSIVAYYEEISLYNLRIIISWIDVYKKLYMSVIEHFSKSKYYQEIVDEFLKYSIWAVYSYKTNRKLIVHREYWGEMDTVTIDGENGLRTYSYPFIDKYIVSDYLDCEDLCQAARAIEHLNERNAIYNDRPQIESTGKAYQKLREWRYMRDKEVEDTLAEVEEELKNGKYAYSDFKRILSTFVYHSDTGLYKGNLSNIQETMLSLVKKDNIVQNEDDFMLELACGEDDTEFNKIYAPIAEARKLRNTEISKEIIEEKNIYMNADAFYEDCKNRADYYSTHNSFMQYVDKTKLLNLIKSSDLRGLYVIAKAFRKVYHMSNAREFFLYDLESLREIKKIVSELIDSNENEITKTMAIRNMESTIDQIISKIC